MTVAWRRPHPLPRKAAISRCWPSNWARGNRGINDSCHSLMTISNLWRYRAEPSHDTLTQRHHRHASSPRIRSSRHHVITQDVTQHHHAAPSRTTRTAYVRIRCAAISRCSWYPVTVCGLRGAYKGTKYRLSVQQGLSNRRLGPCRRCGTHTGDVRAQVNDSATRVDVWMAQVNDWMARVTDSHTQIDDCPTRVDDSATLVADWMTRVDDPLTQVNDSHRQVG